MTVSKERRIQHHRQSVFGVHAAHGQLLRRVRRQHGRIHALRLAAAAAGSSHAAAGGTDRGRDMRASGAARGNGTASGRARRRCGGTARRDATRANATRTAPTGGAVPESALQPGIPHAPAPTQGAARRHGAAARRQCIGARKRCQRAEPASNWLTVTDAASLEPRASRARPAPARHERPAQRARQPFAARDRPGVCTRPAPCAICRVEPERAAASRRHAQERAAPFASRADHLGTDA